MKSRIASLESTIAHANYNNTSSGSLPSQLDTPGPSQVHDVRGGVTRIIDELRQQVASLTAENKHLTERNEMLGDQLEESRMAVESLRSELGVRHVQSGQDLQNTEK